MRREILFRGKRVESGEWIEGFYFCRSTQHYIKVPTLRNGVCVLTDYEASATTVGQYTGLTDKTGAKIFEGDILKDTLNWVYEVRWDNDDGRFLGYHSKPRGDTYICYVGREPKSTVIGNIHDNPELLGGDNQCT